MQQNAPPGFTGGGLQSCAFDPASRTHAAPPRTHLPPAALQELPADDEDVASLPLPSSDETWDGEHDATLDAATSPASKGTARAKGPTIRLENLMLVPWCSALTDAMKACHEPHRMCDPWARVARDVAELGALPPALCREERTQALHAIAEGASD